MFNRDAKGSEVFTRQELRVLIFLVVSLFMGIALWAYRSRWQPLPVSELGSRSVPNGIKPLLKESTQSEPKQTGIIEVNLNTAGREELETLPGIGPVIAGHIIEYREKIGGFKSTEELIHVKGIGENTLDKIREFITLIEEY